MTTHDTPEAGDLDLRAGVPMTDTDMEYTISERVISDTPATHDTPEAALAAALRSIYWAEKDDDQLDFAAAILAAMPDWTLVPRDDEDREFRVVAGLAAQMKSDTRLISDLSTELEGERARADLAAAERARIAEVVRGLPWFSLTGISTRDASQMFIARAAVLALFEP